ncbi:MAG TPA: division/cell wall cluster transcriptional repressor MraZ [Solirubrobacteraceae bacterium]|nr:division/cell wall cluster transcriptional repressor MraZ [Solirubrobacteraceae bacterium]
MIFRGTFEHTLDAKHRLTVPSRYRDELKPGLVLAISPETAPGTPRSLGIWTRRDHEEYAQAALKGLNPLSPQARELKRTLFAWSFETDLDSANRVMIPGPLLEYAGLDRDVTLIGAGECLEIWDRETYAGYNQGLLARFPEIAASFDHTA